MKTPHVVAVSLVLSPGHQLRARVHPLDSGALVGMEDTREPSPENPEFADRARVLRDPRRHELAPATLARKLQQRELLGECHLVAPAVSERVSTIACIVEQSPYPGIASRGKSTQLVPTPHGCPGTQLVNTD